jgi:hypothetical protein
MYKKIFMKYNKNVICRLRRLRTEVISVDGEQTRTGIMEFIWYLHFMTEVLKLCIKKEYSFSSSIVPFYTSDAKINSQWEQR